MYYLVASLIFENISFPKLSFIFSFFFFIFKQYAEAGNIYKFFLFSLFGKEISVKKGLPFIFLNLFLLF